jgi:hypothetical protein
VTYAAETAIAASLHPFLVQDQESGKPRGLDTRWNIKRSGTFRNWKSTQSTKNLGGVELLLFEQKRKAERVNEVFEVSILYLNIPLCTV